MSNKTEIFTIEEIDKVLQSNPHYVTPTRSFDSISIEDSIRSLEFAYRSTKNVQYLNDIIILEQRLEAC